MCKAKLNKDIFAMKHSLSYILLLIVAIGHLSDAKNICQKISDGDNDEEVALEEINQCYECDGWYAVAEGQVGAFSPSYPEFVDESNDGWSWCATDTDDVLEITFEQPIRLGGFTLRSSSPDAFVKELRIQYGEDRDETSDAKNLDSETIFDGNNDDYTVKENKFLIPILTKFVRVHIVSFESRACSSIRFYSCEKTKKSVARIMSDNTPFSDVDMDDTDECIDVKTACPELHCLNKFLKDSNGCDRCACDDKSVGRIESDIIIDALSRRSIEVAYGVRKDPYNLMRGGIKGDRSRWNDYRSGNKYLIPYTFEAGLSSKARQAIPPAMRAMEQVTCLKFVQRTNQEYFLKFFTGAGCYSYVGNVRARGGQQISIGNRCEYIGIIQHEILHALGFWHEQSRKDRDQFVTIFYENIQSGRENNFEKRDTVDFGSPYDYKSVMHYSNKAFSSNGKDTIQAKRQPNLSLGQRQGLSAEDIKQVNSMYPCSRPVTTTTMATRTTRAPTITTRTTRPTTCGNKFSDWSCTQWKNLGYCNNARYKAYVQRFCAKSCGKCGGGNCKDRKRKCPQRRWRCTSRNLQIRQNMLKNCPKTCGVC